MRTVARLRRSLLFVPGAEPRKLERARGAGADTLLFDLEDSVVPDQKAAARVQVAEALRGGGFGDSEPAVRVNAVTTPFFNEDLDAIVEAGARTVMLPKAESAETIHHVVRRLDVLEQRLGLTQSVALLALVETAAGVASVRDVAGTSARIEALCFGHADFSLDMGLADSDPSTGVVLHARCTVAIAAKACRIAPIDNVCLAVKDQAAFRDDTLLGIRLGFEGKLCIHPDQVPLANALYTPTSEQLAYADRVIEACNQAQAAGLGVFTVDGKMVDAPLIASQRRVLERARRSPRP
ncbi:MAG: CoA ester lyase [Myxococcales bacterium]